jgi:hypothetical protein
LRRLENTSIPGYSDHQVISKKLMIKLVATSTAVQ